MQRKVAPRHTMVTVVSDWSIAGAGLHCRSLRLLSFILLKYFAQLFYGLHCTFRFFTAGKISQFCLFHCFCRFSPRMKRLRIVYGLIRLDYELDKYAYSVIAVSAPAPVFPIPGACRRPGARAAPALTCTRTQRSRAGSRAGHVRTRMLPHPLY